MRTLQDELGDDYAQWMSWNDIEDVARQLLLERDQLRETARRLIGVMNRLGYASTDPEANDAWAALREAVTPS